MNIAVLTSSRADYGIYVPLLKALRQQGAIDLTVVAFGMHTLKSQGNTVSDVLQDGYSVDIIDGMPPTDSVRDIAVGYGKIAQNFAKYWAENQYDCVFALGDRWEMSAAVQASIPYNQRIAHIHGGETTLGAIDNIYRDQISLASSLHFTAAEPFSERLSKLLLSRKGIHTVGSLSISDVNLSSLPSWDVVKSQFSIPFDRFALVTLHPETVNQELNTKFASTICNALEERIRHGSNFLVTGANSDAEGSIYNDKFKQLGARHPQSVSFVQNLGRLNYFRAMKQSLFLCGNTSSGIIEAASFGKYVVNLGERQKGRLTSNNVIHVPFEHDQIDRTLVKVELLGEFGGKNIYSGSNPTQDIIDIIMQ